eukprot:SAG11_NODE_36443_length_261_cov_1.172840_1_plen_26_part_10
MLRCDGAQQERMESLTEKGLERRGLA